MMGGSGDSSRRGDTDCQLDLVDLAKFWETFFIILESLLRIHCNPSYELVISHLNQYLDGILKNLPPFRYSILLIQVLEHHNCIIIHYGITFILEHRISLKHDDILMKNFYEAFNTTYLHANDSKFTKLKIDGQKLVEYFQRSDSFDLNCSLKMIKMINWHSVPLWVIFKSIAMCMQSMQSKNCEGIEIRKNI